jgi:hypothetical protein
MPLMMHPDHNRWETVEDLTHVAGTASQQPPPPPGGIPRQWLPAFVRWPIRLMMLPFVWMDLASQAVARKILPPPWKQEGQCQQRGNCCYYVLLPEPKGFLGRLFYFWHTQINGFYARRPEPVEAEGQRMRVMGCRYLQADGRCGHHKLRPTLCREWPLIRYFGQPRILRGCGFQAVPRHQTDSESE